jgi:hypothetical protein
LEQNKEFFLAKPKELNVNTLKDTHTLLRKFNHTDVYEFNVASSKGENYVVSVAPVAPFSSGSGSNFSSAVLDANWINKKLHPMFDAL